MTQSGKSGQLSKSLAMTQSGKSGQLSKSLAMTQLGKSGQVQEGLKIYINLPQVSSLPKPNWVKWRKVSTF